MTKELAHHYRASSGLIIASLMKSCGDLSMAEDAFHEACAQASQFWAERGIPDNPTAWLMTASKRRLVDTFRSNSLKVVSEQLHENDLESSLEIGLAETDHEIPDERLKLIFTCCHPALKPETQVALTLSVLCGLKVREIARAFLTSESTMRRRLSRAKNKIRVNAIPYEVPTGSRIEQRLSAVLSVVYLIYNESHTAYEGQTLTRSDLAKEALRLSSLLRVLFPHPEVDGLHALLLLNESRKPARVDNKGRLVPLELQDRSLWDAKMSSEGCELLLETMKRGQIQKYQIQASISAVHCQSPRWEDTDWPQIVGLYQQLLRFESSDVVLVNMAVAYAYSGAVKTAYDLLEKVQARLSHYQPFHAAFAHVNGELGNVDLSKKHYQIAMDKTSNAVEREFLRNRLTSVSDN